MGLCVGLALLMLLGKVLFNREFGIYVFINLSMCAVFLMGATAARRRSRHATLLWAQAYYGFLLLLVLIGLPVGLYELTQNSARVERYCAETSCTGQEADRWLTLAYLGGTLGLFLWCFLFTAMARVVFVFCCAVERVNHQRGGGALHPLVMATAWYLPNYPRWEVKLRAILFQDGCKSFFLWFFVFCLGVLFFPYVCGCYVGSRPTSSGTACSIRML